MIRFWDYDWREVLNEWSEYEIECLLDICEEKLSWLRYAKARMQSVEKLDRIQVAGMRSSSQPD